MDDFNQSSKDGVWGRLEDAVFADVDVQDLKVSAFGGPVFQDDDRVYRGTRLPREYWKILAYVEQGEFKSHAFLLTQNLNPFEALDLDEFRAFQVTPAELEYAYRGCSSRTSCGVRTRIEPGAGRRRPGTPQLASRTSSGDAQSSTSSGGSAVRSRRASPERRVRAECVEAHSELREGLPGRAPDRCVLVVPSAGRSPSWIWKARRMASRAVRNDGFLGVSLRPSTTACQVTR